MHISIQSLNFESNKYPDLSKNFITMTDFGARYLDMAMLEGWQGIYPSRLMDINYFTEILVVLQNCGMTVDSFNCGFIHQVTCKTEEEFQIITNHFEKVCELATILKVRNITIGPGTIQSKSDVEPNIALLLKRLPIWARIASKHGVSFSLECHQGTTLERLEDVEIVLRELYPLVGLTFDPSHLEMQGISLEQSRSVMKYVVHSHIRGASLNNMQEGLEKSTLDIPACIKMLKNIGYKHNVAIEYFLDLNNGKELPSTIKLLESCGMTL
ncbi:MAG: sugar phosphate isomerase/epimerase [Spirochaetaceae bacterium]